MQNWENIQHSGKGLVKFHGRVNSRFSDSDQYLHSIETGLIRLKNDKYIHKLLKKHSYPVYN